MKNLSVISSGMITGVGLDNPSTCAAIRTGINNFEETRFIDQAGEWIIGSMVPLYEPWRGRLKLLNFAVASIRECLAPFEQIPENQTALLLCTAENDRPGRLTGIDEELLDEIQSALGLRFHRESRVIRMGRVSGIHAINLASQLLSYSDINYCIIAGVDTLLVAPTLAVLEEKEYLLTSINSDGVIPGEAGAAVLISSKTKMNVRYGETKLSLLGAGTGHEKATVNSEDPLRADGLVAAINGALKDASIDLKDLDFRITDINGKQYYFKEAALALTRILRSHKEEFDIWHPADCIGEVGAAIVPCVLSIILTASRKNYLPGKNILFHCGNDSGERAALVMCPEDHGM